MTFEIQVPLRNASEVATCLNGLNLNFASYEGRGMYMEFFIHDIDINGFDILETGLMKQGLI